MSIRKTKAEGATVIPLVHSTVPGGADRRSSQMASFSLRRKVKEFVRTNVDDFLNPLIWVEVLVEFILCTFVSIIVIWALTTINPARYNPSSTHFAIFAGVAIIALIEGYGPLCGAPVNPVGVWGFLIVGRISLVKAIMYMVAEIAGSATGGMIGISLTPANQSAAFHPIVPGPGVSIGMGMAIEGILAFNLLIVALSVTNPKTKSVMPSIPIAFCVAGGVFAAGTHTAGLANPVIAFGPAVAAKNFHMHFPVYWGGPFIGATVGAIFYKLVTTAKKVLDRHPVSHEPEEKDDTSTKNCKSITYYPGDAQIAIHL